MEQQQQKVLFLSSGRRTVYTRRFFVLLCFDDLMCCNQTEDFNFLTSIKKKKAFVQDSFMYILFHKNAFLVKKKILYPYINVRIWRF